ncbi:hypothetical protein BOTBODRAFT_48043 [Botryobasidium botryosum FD-172 SS1]|uniref:Uncharacterized protein n=1 Tax=Botryobasidium botryosum (strain FD-172 SS1) TaxID=930990 RepID=A0A067LZH0_BOTB1|nr:hypothetical protein BOTBODRAFT_48043 [Botryobasidium botryosum FD-172 SS1]
MAQFSYRNATPARNAASARNAAPACGTPPSRRHGTASTSPQQSPSRCRPVLQPSSNLPLASMVGLRTTGYSKCPSFAVHNNFIYDTKKRATAYEHLTKRLLAAAEDLFQYTNADVAVWAHRPEGRCAATQYISQGILNDPNAHPLMEPVPGSLEVIFEIRKQVFQAKMSSKHAAPREASEAEVSDHTSADELDFGSCSDEDEGGGAVDLGPFPDRLCKFLHGLKLSDDVFEDIETAWMLYAGDRKFITERLANLELDAAVVRRIENRIFMELAVIEYADLLLFI